MVAEPPDRYQIRTQYWKNNLWGKSAKQNTKQNKQTCIGPKFSHCSPSWPSPPLSSQKTTSFPSLRRPPGGSSPWPNWSSASVRAIACRVDTAKLKKAARNLTAAGPLPVHKTSQGPQPGIRVRTEMFLTKEYFSRMGSSVILHTRHHTSVPAAISCRVDTTKKAATNLSATYPISLNMTS